MKFPSLQVISSLEKLASAGYVGSVNSRGNKMKLNKREREFLQTFVDIAQRLLSTPCSYKGKRAGQENAKVC
jgi:hypothetical protein